MHFELLDELVIIFLLSIVVNLVCNKIKLTATVGFLLTGVLCGPSLLGIVDSQSISDVAELGVAMLLFTIGMELSGEALSRLKRPVFLGGSLQIGLTVLAMWMALRASASDPDPSGKDIIGFFPLFAMIFIGPVNLAGGIIGIVGATGTP